MKNKKYFFAFAAGVLLVYFTVIQRAEASYHFEGFLGKPPLHIFRAAQKAPAGLAPATIKRIYNLPSIGGHGTIAIIDAYDAPNIEKDLSIFNDTYGIVPCTVKNSCLEKHMMATGTTGNSGWALETSLDVEWAHAIAPQAKILLVEAKTASGANLLHAIDYAAARKDVVAISMSWGGAEFSEETSLDQRFVSKSGAIFFASSGDNGAGVSWPAASPNVVGVGGTSLELFKSGIFISESAWPGSGGGISAYEPEPYYQRTYNIPLATGRRAVPDISYNADPKSGYSVYKSVGTSKNGKNGWYTVGGTSAGAPHSAPIHPFFTS